MTREGAALAGALCLAFIIPPILLIDLEPVRGSRESREVASLIPSTAATMSSAIPGNVFDRGKPIDISTEQDTTYEEASVPRVVGIVGRLPYHAIALIARGGASVRSMTLGETVDGWQLRALSVDTALFVRGTRNERVKVGADPADQ